MESSLFELMNPRVSRVYCLFRCLLFRGALRKLPMKPVAPAKVILLDLAPCITFRPPALRLRRCYFLAGGIRTVSARYTVALAVCTPPQMTEAPLTSRSSPLPVGFHIRLDGCMGSGQIIEIAIWPGITW